MHIAPCWSYSLCPSDDGQQGVGGGGAGFILKLAPATRQHTAKTAGVSAERKEVRIVWSRLGGCARPIVKF